MPDDLPVFDTLETDESLPYWKPAEYTPPEWMKREALKRQRISAEVEAQQGKIRSALIGLGERAAYTIADALAKVDPTGVAANILARQGVGRTPPILAPEDIKTVEQFVGIPTEMQPVTPVEKVIKGAQQFGEEFASGLTDPGVIAPAGAIKRVPEVARLFQAQMAAAIPPATERFIEPQELPERISSGLALGTAVALPIGIERQLTRPQLKPAIKTMDGEVIEGKAGETHNDIIAKNDLKPEDIDRREFTDQQGNELSREQAAAARPDITPEVVPAEGGKPAELHSTDLPEAKAEPVETKMPPTISEAPIIDLYGTRTPAIKQIQFNIREGFSFVENMTPEKGIAEMDKSAAFWSSEVERLKKVSEGKTEPNEKDVQDWRYWEGKFQKQMTPDQWADNYGIPYAQEQLAKATRTKDAILRLERINKKRAKTKEPPGLAEAPSQQPEAPAAVPVSEAKVAGAAPPATPPAMPQGAIGQGKVQVGEVIPTPTAPKIPSGPGAKTIGEPSYSAIGQLTDRLKATAPTGTEEMVSTRDRVVEAWSKGKTIGQRALASARSLSESLKDTARGIRRITDVDRRLGTLDWELQESSARSIQAGKAMLDQVKNKTDREAVAIWIDSGGDEALIREGLAALPEGTRPSIRAAVDRAANLTPELKQFAQDLRQFYGLREQDAISHEIFEHGLADYFTHIWERESNMPDSVRAAVNGGAVNDYFRFARQRKISMFLEGIIQGKVPNLDPANVVPFYNYALDRSIASRKFIRDVAEVTADDGRPALLPTGTAVKVTEEGTPKALIINPRGKAEMNADYRTVDHPALRKWKWAGADENGNPVLYRSDLAVHPQFYERLARIMDRGRLSPTTWGRRLLRASTEVKGFKLGMLSMFHQVHVGSHALWHWTNPFGVREINWDAPETRFAIEKGHLRLAPDPRQITEFSEGIMPIGLVTKIPFLGPWSKAYSEWTFQSYIPRLKMATFDNAYKRALWMREKGLGFKNLSDEQIADRTGDSINSAFGELNQWFLGKYGRDPRFQRLLRGIFLAPDFGEARLRFAEKTLTRYGHEERLAMATMLLTMYIGARIANRLTHGDPEWDEKHAFDVKVGDHWWSMRSVAGDINHAVNDFGNFMYVRLNPLYARTASDWLFGRDPRGKKLTFTEKALKRPVEQLVPIQFGALTRDDQKLWESFVTALGVQTRRDRPDQDVYQLARDWMKASADPKLLERAAALEQAVFPSSPYAKLRYALQNNDTLAATKAVKELRESKHTDKQIREAFDPTKPFTGSHKTESAFKQSLTAPQMQLYDEAVNKRWEIKRRLVEALSIPPTDVPPPDSELPTWDNTSPL